MFNLIPMCRIYVEDHIFIYHVIDNLTTEVTISSMYLSNLQKKWTILTVAHNFPIHSSLNDETCE